MKRALENSSSSVEADTKRSRYDSTNNNPVWNPLYSALKLRATLDNIKRNHYGINDIDVGYGYNGRSVLHYALIWNCGMEIIEELISKGASINGRDRVGMTPLHFAAVSNIGMECVPKLLALGADVNARNHSGETPLYFAISQYKEIELIKMLFEHGADIKYNYEDIIIVSRFFLIKAYELGDTSSAEFLIKTIFLKNFANNFSELTELMKDTVFSRGDMFQFMVNCIAELSLMQETKIISTYSVLDLALSEYGYPKPLYSNGDLTDTELIKIFPIYNDIIKQKMALALERGHLINLFKDSQTYRISNRHDSECTEKEVILNFDCITKICSYMTNQELQNFSQAFHVSLEIQTEQPSPRPLNVEFR